MGKKKSKKRNAAVAPPAQPKPSLHVVPSREVGAEAGSKPMVGNQHAWNALVWCGAFILYVITCASSPLNCGDALELATVSSIQGVAHAPGYPLFTLLGKIFATLLPGPVALRYSLMTAAFGSTAVLAIYVALYRLFEHRGIALVSAAVYAVSYHQWLYSLVTEVSVLSALFAVVLPLILWEAHRNGGASSPAVRYRYAKIWAVVLGLSLTHHALVLFLLPGMLWFLVTDLQLRPCTFTPREWGVLSCGFLLGLLPILYLLYCASANPPINYGDVRSVGNLFRHLLRTEYGSFSLTADGQGLAAHGGLILEPVAFYGEMLVRSFTLPGALLAALGFIYVMLEKRPVFRLYALSFLLSGVGFFLMTRMDSSTIAARLTLEKFLSVSFTAVPLFIAAGSLVLVRYVRLQWWLATILPVAMLAMNFPVLNFRQFQASEQFGDDLLRSVEPNSLFIVHGDAPLFVAWYLQYVEHRRPDIRIISHSMSDWYVKQLRERYPDINLAANLNGPAMVRTLIEDNVDRFPIYTHGIPGEELAASGLNGNPFSLQPSGLAYKVTRTFDSDGNDSTLWDSFSLRNKLQGPLAKNNFVTEINDMYMRALHNRSAFFYKNHELQKAIRFAKQALDFDPDFLPTQRALEAMRREAGRGGVVP